MNRQRSAYRGKNPSFKPRAESREPKAASRRCGGFTLIELLTVIAIIAILAGLLFPTIKSALQKTEIAKARETIHQIGGAFRSYYTEFGRWPTNISTTFPLNTNLFANTKGLSFLDVASKDINGSGQILDPWRSPYQCVTDAGYVGWVANPLDASATISNGYAIWSNGPDGTNDNTGETSAKNKDNIKSWAQ